MIIDLNAAQSNFRGGSAAEYDPELDEIIRKQKDEYLIQSVANLGQRLGVKGDSIATNSFTFRSIFSQAINNNYFSTATHIGKIERRYGSMFLSIVPKSTLKHSTEDSQGIEYCVYNSGDIYVTTATIENPTEILNNVQFYKQNSVIALRSSNFVFAGIGCRKNEISNEFEEIEFIYEEFDKETNNIVNALRLRNIGGYNVVVTARNTPDKVYIDTYQLADGAHILEDNFKTAYNVLSDMNGISSSGVNVGISNESKINRMSIDYWLNTFKISKYAGSHLQASKAKDRASIETIKVRDMDSGDKTKILSKYSGIDDVFEWMVKYDGNMLLNDIKEIYSQALYASSNDSFKEQILCAIFNGVYNKYPMSATIYVPIDFEFNYYCNSNDQWKIYGGVNGLNVRFVNTSITPKNLANYYSNDQLIANIAGDNKSSIYNYDVEYDNSNSDIVYRINVRKQYTLPYINSDDYWVINEQITNVQAKGKDAGNPNVIIVYNYNKLEDGGFEIISGGNIELLKSNLVSWKNKVAFIEPIDQINIDDPQIVTKSDLLKLSCKVPNIESIDEAAKNKIMPFLQYALIMNISSVQCFDVVDSETIDKYGEYGVVTTYWRFDEKLNEFVVVENPAFEGNISNVALDIVAMTNLNNLVKWHIQHTEYKHPDKYSHKWLVFENANIELKNNVADYRTYIYPVMMNKSAADYNFSNYNNDLNFYIKYSDAVAGAEDNHVSAVSQTNARFIASDNIETTNSLYYIKNGLFTKNYNEYIPNIDVPMLNLSEVLTKDINVVNRTNMISFDAVGKMHYSYIGTSFDDLNKQIIHIGGAKTNINIGEDTLINNSNRNLFVEPNKLSIDLETTDINGFAYVMKDLEVGHDVNTLHLNWTVCKNGLFTVYKTNYIPESKFMFSTNYGDKALNYSSPVQFNNNTSIRFKGTLYNENMILGQMKRYYEMASNYESTSTNLNNYRLWIPSFYVMPSTSKNSRHLYDTWAKIIYCGELLYIPGLLCKLGLGNWCKKIGKVIVKSNMDIVTYSSSPIFLMTSNMFISNIDYSAMTLDDAFVGWNYNDKDIYVGNSLDISYYIDDTNFLNITINEATNSNKVRHLFKMQFNY